jgi:hypothetical protein
MDFSTISNWDSNSELHKQEGGTAQISDFGQGFKRFVDNAVSVFYLDSTTERFEGFFGGNVFFRGVDAKNLLLESTTRNYKGILPLDQLPEIETPNPWE